jgi:hypothetical protein
VRKRALRWCEIDPAGRLTPAATIGVRVRNRAALGEIGYGDRPSNRHDGGFYIAAAASFVADHKTQGERLDSS